MLPVVLCTRAFVVFGREVTCALLDDGDRVVLASDSEWLGKAMDDPANNHSDEGLQALARWIMGGEVPFMH